MKTITTVSRGLVVATTALAAVALVACSSSEGPSDATSAGATEGGTITWAYSTQAVSNWDPLVIGGTSGTYLTTPIYASLFTLDEKHQIVPSLASGYSYNDDGTAVTITLKPDLTFQDGTPVNADAVKFNYDRIYSQTNSALKGVYADVKDVVVVDDLTVRFDLKQPDFQIPYILAEKTGQLPSPSAVEKDPTAFNATGPVGAGPFTVEELVPGDHVVLKKWDGYWNADNIHIDEIRINFGISPESLIPTLQAGDANFALITPDLIEAAKAADLKVLSGTDRLWGSSFLSINKNVAPFDNPEVVEAIRYAINPEQFSKQLYAGLGTASYQPFPEGHVNYSPDLAKEFNYNPDKAKKLLADAGFKPGEISIEVATLNSNNFDKVGEILQSQLGAVGITVKLNILDSAAWAKSYYSNPAGFSSSLFGWVGRDSPVAALSDQYDSLGVLNLSKPSTSSDFSKALSVARSTPLDSPDYQKNLQAAAKLGYENGSNISLVSYATPIALAPGISDLPNVDGFIDWTGVTVTP